MQFLSTLSLRRATPIMSGKPAAKRFLSTLSLRRATMDSSPAANCQHHFYPRSPCGERLHYDNYNLHCVEISIHALLAESDFTLPVLFVITVLFLSTLSLRRATYRLSLIFRFALFLSTLSLRRATLAVSAALQLIPLISIHALLAESDQRT